ncbi:DNA cytosine methyltransferase [Alteromonas gracilis]|uniref:DNA cytosine methyltransferase n=1 Tax=Alteromonas gracilis TaxID=1479524 RepID=UPI003735E721
MQRFNHLDMFTGLGGFSLAAKQSGFIDTMLCSETDPYNNRLIDEKFCMENAGNICDLAVPTAFHSAITDEDVVPCEETGFSTVTYEDFFEGVVPFPDIATGGFPCQNVSSANVNDNSGIDGKQSSLVYEQLRIIEDLEIPYCVFENAERLNRKGLSYIVARLTELGYIVEWETISATAFNYPHYRHRVYIVAYLPSTGAGQSKRNVFDHVRQVALANLDKPFKMPLLEEEPKWVLGEAVCENPKSIKLRTKRINSLGNAIIPDIAKAIFDSIRILEVSKDDKSNTHISDDLLAGVREGTKWVLDSKYVTCMPTRGVAHSDAIFSNGKCDLLNVSKQRYVGLYSTLLKKDGNNNFTCKSRLTRPGKLGGLVGEIMAVGANAGGLHPEFCEQFMGYPKGYTELPNMNRN